MKKMLRDISAFLLITGTSGGVVLVGVTLLLWVIAGTDGVDWAIVVRGASASVGLIFVSLLAFLASERTP